MPWEKLLCCKPGAHEQRCDPSVLEGIVEARKLVLRFFNRGKGADEAKLSNICDVLIKRKGTWVSRDPDFGLDISVLSNLGGQLGVNHTQDLISMLIERGANGSRDIKELFDDVCNISEEKWSRFL